MIKEIALDIRRRGDSKVISFETLYEREKSGDLRFFFTIFYLIANIKTGPYRPTSMCILKSCLPAYSENRELLDSRE